MKGKGSLSFCTHIHLRQTQDWDRCQRTEEGGKIKGPAGGRRPAYWAFLQEEMTWNLCSFPVTVCDPVGARAGGRPQEASAASMHPLNWDWCTQSTGLTSNPQPCRGWDTATQGECGRKLGGEGRGSVILCPTLWTPALGHRGVSGSQASQVPEPRRFGFPR